VAVLRDVARHCDVVVENMRPGVLDRRGLGYDVLSADNPGTVLLSMSMAGAKGPMSKMRGYAPVMSGLAGLERLMGYAPDDVTGMYTFSFADANGAIYGVIGTLAAVYERRASGVGAFLDFSQTEACINAMSVQIAEAQDGTRLGPEDKGLDPNGDPDQYLQAVVRCAGDDQWMAVVVPDNQHADAVAQVVGAPADVPRADLLESVEAWCRTMARDLAVEGLAAAGAYAAPVRTWPEVHKARHGSDRLSIDVPHPYAARHEVYVPPWRFDGDLPGRPLRAPLLGEHTDQVISSLTNTPSAVLEELRLRGALVDSAPESAISQPGPSANPNVI
jgi:crotonobetainyl-CoA:carnitine CoA-transferase CaiB-like acyl-CoA transferase